MIEVTHHIGEVEERRRCVGREMEGKEERRRRDRGDAEERRRCVGERWR